MPTFSPAASARLLPRSAVRLLQLSSSPTCFSLVPRRRHHHPLPSSAPRWCWRCLCASAVATGGVGLGETKVGEFRRRAKIADVKGGEDEGLERLGESLVVKGWVRTCRAQSSVTFIDVNDGSCLSNMQCVMSSDAEGYDQVESGAVTTGSSVMIEGVLVKSQGSKQKVEVKVGRLVVIGKSEPATFPIQKKKVSREFLRSVAHLRPRTNTFGAVARVRNALAYATHKFFQENGFVWVSSPIITASDCEGAGEQFCVTTLVPAGRESTETSLNSIPTDKDGKVDWSKDFFGKPAFLTVSGQLNAETYATALSDVYTFGPTFRAENSHTSRHLAEFWMIEPELAFADLNDDMACATTYLQYVVGFVLDNCEEDMNFFNTWIEKGIVNRLRGIVENDFIQLTYSDAVEILLKSKMKFEFPVKWGSDLQSEHERHITEEVFGGCPVIIRDFPKDIKAFYMRINDDGKTVAAMDLLVPRINAYMEMQVSCLKNEAKIHAASSTPALSTKDGSHIINEECSLPRKLQETLQQSTRDVKRGSLMQSSALASLQTALPVIPQCSDDASLRSSEVVRSSNVEVVALSQHQRSRGGCVVPATTHMHARGSKRPTVARV